MIDYESLNGSKFEEMFIEDIDEAALADLLVDYITISPDSHTVYYDEEFYGLSGYEKVLIDLMARAAISKLKHDDWFHDEGRRVQELRTNFDAPMGMLRRFEEDGYIEIRDDERAYIKLCKINDIVRELPHEPLESVLVSEDNTESNQE